MTASQFLLLQCRMIAAAVAFAAALPTPAFTETPGNRSSELRSGWKFAKGDLAGVEAPAFDDSGWSTVRVPHDWAIAGPFDPALDGSTGKLPWRGVGWYRQSFTLDCKPNEHVYLDFDGVMAFPKVFVNGKLAGEWDYGYSPFRIDATPFVNRTGRNVLAVRVDTTKHGSRWYPGAGIYRKVTLQVRNPVHVAQWATFVTTPEVSDVRATVTVRTAVENHTDRDAKVGVVFRFRDPDGKVVRSISDSVTIPTSDVKEVKLSTELPKPQQWDIETPRLYTVETAIVSGSAPLEDFQDSDVLDHEATPFGIRTIEFTADDGFHLNGRRVQLHGVNLHHDQGPLGAAFYRRAMERQLEIMRDMGVNALRTSHNIPAADVLELCDRMGIVVWEECFDKWNATADRVAGKPSHEEHAQRHLRSMVMRDRNHPSVVIWSIGNEISADREGVSPQRVKMMSDIVRKYDQSRPVGLGCHIPEQVDAKIFDALDLTGWNYGRRYARFRERYPDRPIVYSESASALSTRGFYQLPLPTTKTDYSTQHQVDSYDFNAAPWSDIADSEFKLMERDRFVAGEFVWTGFDYLGEPTPFEQQANSSYFGIVDMCGMPKDRFFLYRSYWRPDTPTVHIVPHWNWPDRVGQPVPVFVYTNGDSAELFLNGKSLGKRQKGPAPERAANASLKGVASASSNRADDPASNACDADKSTSWHAANDDDDAWWEIDLGSPQSIKLLQIEFERESKNYGYVVQTSADHKNWTTTVEHPTSDKPRWGGPREAVHRCDANARYLRLEFNRLANGVQPCIKDFGVFQEYTELPYYDPTYAYRLRWNDVAYEPGELKAIAYKNGKEIGSAIERTSGAPAAIRLTPDRTKLAASGDDLCYVLVEAVDQAGTPCRLAENTIHFDVTGPAEIAGVGNGNPLSMEPFQAHDRKLFFGKAMLILRPLEGQGGEIRISATSSGLADGEAVCHSAR